METVLRIASRLQSLGVVASKLIDKQGLIEYAWHLLVEATGKRKVLDKARQVVGEQKVAHQILVSHAVAWVLREHILQIRTDVENVHEVGFLWFLYAESSQSFYLSALHTGLQSVCLVLIEQTLAQTCYVFTGYRLATVDDVVACKVDESWSRLAPHHHSFKLPVLCIVDATELFKQIVAILGLACAALPRKVKGIDAYNGLIVEQTVEQLALVVEGYVVEIENKRIGLSLIVKIAFGVMQGFVPVVTVYGLLRLYHAKLAHREGAQEAIARC